MESRPRNGQMGRYRLVGLLASGGMAQVYLALSGELSGFRTLVVVKRILPRLASNAQFVRMFFDEARIAARLDHPNIARIIEVGHDGDEYFLAMEVVQGRPLSALLRRARKSPTTPLTHAQSAYIIAQAANALGYAHALTGSDGRPLNVVHRDVSPQNILVSFGGTVKVIDFGVARALGRVTETVPGGLKGKIQYMSPEQVRGMAVDQRSDVFALGVVLWEALCGRRLYLRAAEMDSLRAIVEEPVMPPSKLVPTSARLERIVLQALEKDPAKRFQNASEMALALERHAFASDGFNPLQISTAMKTLFATDYARWNRTVAAAMDTEGPPEAWSDTAGTFLAPGAIDLRSDGSKVVASSDLTPATAVEEARSDSKSVPTAVTAADDSRPDNRSAPSSSIVGQPVPINPSARQVRLGASIAVVGAAVAVVLSVFTLLRPARTVTVIRPAPAAASRGTPPIEAMPTPTTGEGATAPPQEGPTVEPVAAPPPVAANERAAAGTDSGASMSAPPAEKTRPKARPVLRKRFDRRAPRPPTSPTDKPPATDAATFSPAAGPPTAPAPPAVATPAVPVKAAPLATPAAAPAPAAALTPAAAPTSTPAASRCSIRLGSTPWAEVWIDGQNTKGHTPYSDEITCGKHELLFKRDDLGLTKAATVTLQPGAIFKRSFALDGK